MSFNKQQLLHMMANPSSISEETLEELQDVVTEYPYFQLAHTFIAKAKHDAQAPDAITSLNHAAVYAPSRRLLRQIFYDNLCIEEEKENAGNDNSVYQELEENLSNLRSNRAQNLQKEQEEEAEDNSKKKLTSEKEESSISPSEKEEPPSPEKRKESTGNEPYLLDYLKDVEHPIQSDRLGINQKRQMELIEKFMTSERDVTIRWRTQEEQPVDLSEKNPDAAAGNFATENMAGIYVKQGKKDKAIQIYEQLSLKYPQKKTYFAEKIESLKEK